MQTQTARRAGTRARNRLPKEGGAILGVATAPIGAAAAHDRVLMIGVIERNGIAEGVLSARVTRDGTDSTARISRMVSASRFAAQIKFIALDGISVAGLNVVDIRLLERRLGVSCIVITRSKPHRSLMRKVLELHGARLGIDISKRIDLLEATLPRPIAVEGMNLLTNIPGKHRKSVLVKGVSDALRLAHLIASGVSRGESKGRI